MRLNGLDATDGMFDLVFSRPQGADLLVYSCCGLRNADTDKPVLILMHSSSQNLHSCFTLPVVALHCAILSQMLQFTAWLDKAAPSPQCLSYLSARSRASSFWRHLSASCPLLVSEHMLGPSWRCQPCAEGHGRIAASHSQCQQHSTYIVSCAGDTSYDLDRMLQGRAECSQ